MRNTEPENVAEHSFNVALITHALCTIARSLFGKEVDTNRAVTLALFHDVTEVVTGDIPTPVKHHDDAILRGVRALEGLAAQQLLAMVPDPLKDTYGALIVPGASEVEALRWVRAADKLAAYLKCAAEVAAGNREFVVAKRQLEEIVREMDMPEVEYFLTRFAPSFERTLDEISE